MTVIFPNQQKQPLLISDVCVEPCTRNFICASVGSGKSTLASVICRTYRGLYPTHRIYIVDPKHRFFDGYTDETQDLFPKGLEAQKHGTRKGVFVNARVGNNPIRWNLPKGGAVIVQEEEAVEELFRWVYDNQNINQPILLFMDESFDAMSGTRANPDLRRIIQMGRELGIGTLIINQRPHYIDRTFMSEADRIYYGQLHSKQDRIFVLDETGLRDIYDVQDMPVKPYEWWMIEQKDPRNSRYFTLTGNLVA